MANDRVMDRIKAGDFDVYEAMEEGFEVLSWCPAPTPTVPPTQVHLVLPPVGTLRMVQIIRFKSPRTLDALIEGLHQHRKNVWGEAIKNEGTPHDFRFEWVPESEDDPQGPGEWQAWIGASPNDTILGIGETWEEARAASVDCLNRTAAALAAQKGP